jgi:predicted nuclease of predicted toxin-antitoxin system
MGSLSSELRPIAARISTAPRVYADANVPANVVAALRRDLGWDVLFVVEDEALRRAPDGRHFTRARDLGRTLVTLDADFLDDRRYPSHESPGVLVCRAPDAAGLIRLLVYAGRLLLQPPNSSDPPLLGRTIELTPTILQHDANPARRRRHRPARSGRQRPHPRPRG